MLKGVGLGGVGVEGVEELDGGTSGEDSISDS